MSKKQNTVTAPGIGFTVEHGEKPAPSTTTTTVSEFASFEVVVKVISDKPVRPPNRTRPLGAKKKKRRKQ